MGEIFQVLEAEAQKTPMLLTEVIMRENGGVVNMAKITMSFIEPAPEEMSLSGGEDTIAWLRKWNHHDQEDKSMIREYQETLMGDVLNIQATIGRGERYGEIEDKVGTICEDIITVNTISIQGT